MAPQCWPLHDPAVPAATDRLPLLTLAALFVGYACSYFHRADLAALAPLWTADGEHAALRAALPDIASLGMLVYAFGKLVGGVLAERCGGRLVFVGALAGAGFMELVALRVDAPVPFAVCRAVGMLVLGCAWPALGHVVATVTPRLRLATVMAFLSQSYLLGDAAVRALLAAVVARGGGAHAVLGTSAMGLLSAAGLVGVLLWCGRRPQAPAPDHLVPRTSAPPAGSLRSLLWALAALNFGLAVVREALSLWTPLLLVECCAVPTDDAVRASAWLPLVSGLAVLLVGPFADRGPRALVLVTALPALLGGLALAALACAEAPSYGWFLTAVAAASACLALPMTLASGVLPLRAGVTGGARRLGFVDGAGSFGAVLAGGALARIQTGFGTTSVFATLAAVAALAAVLGVVVARLSAPHGAPGTS